MKAKLLLIQLGLIFLSLIIVVLQVVILNKESTSGLQVNSILKIVEQYERENIILTTEIASSSALLTVAQNAKKLGFANNLQVLSLSKPLPIAYTSQKSF